jgi:hypothetical protein
MAMTNAGLADARRTARRAILGGFIRVAYYQAERSTT